MQATVLSAHGFLLYSKALTLHVTVILVLHCVMYRSITISSINYFLYIWIFRLRGEKVCRKLFASCSAAAGPQGLNRQPNIFLKLS